MQLDTELEKTRFEPREGDRKVHPDVDLDSRKSPPEFDHFSPDPLQQTDRYRLVTPYRLPRRRTDPSEA